MTSPASITKRICDLCSTPDLGYSFDNMQGRFPDIDLLCCRRCLRALTIEGLSVGQERRFIAHMKARGNPLPPRNGKGLLVLQRSVDIRV
ncbi:hypothetical protein [Paracoccus sp. SY]|uniref:hypothetical protein n=1 Tax=Paracoccus sp. SY TaxID=1330255 RepID=UPI0011AF5803|nr:hypothetical protein [Paracoccus sp. SY]